MKGDICYEKSIEGYCKNGMYVRCRSKTLQNWKALVSTTVSDGMYYEITHDGDKGETYLDAYKKWDNQCIVD